jgi:hypothetical protein
VKETHISDDSRASSVSRREYLLDDHRFPHTGRGARVKAKPDPILAANQKGRILRRKERRRFLFVEGKETEKKNLAPRERTRKKKPETRTRNARLDRTIA